MSRPLAAATPLVTIGIPAYNRAAELQRAVDSALAQRSARIEVVISDDASPDPAVWTTVQAIAAAEPRVRAFRQPTNLGHAGNYQWVLDAARGQYFMWLADDDWIDPDYVHRCLSALRADPSLRVACGAARYHFADGRVEDERPVNLCSRRAGLRLVRYFCQVTMNGPLFGLARRDDLVSVGFPDLVGGDWLLVGALAGRGRIRTLADVHIHRSATGLGAHAERLARSFGLSGVRARQHHVLVAVRVAREIAIGPPRFPDLGAVAGMIVGGSAAASILVRFTLADLVRRALGPPRTARIERRISTFLRRRDGR